MKLRDVTAIAPYPLPSLGSASIDSYLAHITRYTRVDHGGKVCQDMDESGSQRRLLLLPEMISRQPPPRPPSALCYT